MKRLRQCHSSRDSSPAACVSSFIAERGIWWWFPSCVIAGCLAPLAEQTGCCATAGSAAGSCAIICSSAPAFGKVIGEDRWAAGWIDSEERTLMRDGGDTEAGASFQNKLHHFNKGEKLKPG